MAFYPWSGALPVQTTAPDRWARIVVFVPVTCGCWWCLLLVCAWRRLTVLRLWPFLFVRRVSLPAVGILPLLAAVTGPDQETSRVDNVDAERVHVLIPAHPQVYPLEEVAGPVFGAQGLGCGLVGDAHEHGGVETSGLDGGAAATADPLAARSYDELLR